MTHKLDLNIGTTIICRDQKCGKLSKVVVDPNTRRVTDLIMSQGSLPAHHSVVPVDAVASASHETIELDLSPTDIDSLQEYRERQYVAPPKGWTQGYYENSYLLHRVGPTRMAYPIDLTPMIVHQLHEGISPDKTVIERGIYVDGRDGKVGTIDHLLIDRDSEEVRFLVVDRGLLKPNVVIPAEHLASVGETLIRLDLSAEQLEDLDSYTPRSEAEVLVEAEKRLLQVPLDPDSIELSFHHGVLRLSGVVSDIKTKRHIIAAVSSIEGVLHVQGVLETADTIQARVITALRTDPRTDIGDIDVIVQTSLVTLAGKVDNTEIRGAASDIATAQQGVVEVINELEVETDRDSKHLRAAWLSNALLAQRVGNVVG